MWPAYLYGSKNDFQATDKNYGEKDMQRFGFNPKNNDAPEEEDNSLE